MSQREEAGTAGRAGLADVARGSALNLAGAVISAAATLAATVIVTRHFSRAVAGAFVTATSLFLIVEAIAGLGAGNGAVYFIARLRPAGAKGRSSDGSGQPAGTSGPPPETGTGPSAGAQSLSARGAGLPAGAQRGPLGGAQNRAPEVPGRTAGRAATVLPNGPMAGADRRVAAILRAAVRPVLVASVLSAVLMLVFAGPLAGFLAGGPLARGGAAPGPAADAIRALAVAVPFAALADTFLGASRGFRNMLPTVVVDRITRPAAQVAGLIAAVAVGRAALLAPLWALPYLPASLAAWLWLRRTRLRPRPAARPAPALRPDRAHRPRPRPSRGPCPPTPARRPPATGPCPPSPEPRPPVWLLRRPPELKAAQPSRRPATAKAGPELSQPGRVCRRSRPPLPFCWPCPGRCRHPVRSPGRRTTIPGHPRGRGYRSPPAGPGRSRRHETEAGPPGVRQIPRRGHAQPAHSPEPGPVGSSGSRSAGRPREAAAPAGRGPGSTVAGRCAARAPRRARAAAGTDHSAVLVSRRAGPAVERGPAAAGPGRPRATVGTRCPATAGRGLPAPDLAERDGAGNAAGFWAFTAPRALAAVAQIVLQRLDIVLVAVISGPAQAAVYAAATRFLVAGQLANAALIQAAQPQLSHLFGIGDRAAAGAVYQATTAWLIVLTWPLYLLSALFGPQLLAVFGRSYQDGATVVVILALAMLLATACGQVDLVLTMTGRSRWSLFNGLLAVLVNVAVDVALIPRAGITGAAIGWAAALAVSNLVPLAQVAWVARIHPFGRGPAAAIAVTAVAFGAVPLAARTALGPGLAASLAGVAAGTLLAVAGLWCCRGALRLAALPGRPKTQLTREKMNPSGPGKGRR